MFEFLVWLFGAFLSIFGFMYIYAKYTDARNFITKKLVICYLICVFLLALIYYFDITFLGVVSYFIISPPLYYLIEYTNFKKFIFYLCIIWIYAMVLDLMAMAFASIILIFYNIKKYWYLFEVFMTLLLFILLILIANVAKVKKLTNSLYLKILNVKYFDVSFIIFSLFVLIASIVISFNLHRLNISILLIIIILLLIVIFSMLIKNKMNMIENEIFLKTLKENNDFYIKMEDENRIFRHNLNAKLLGIKSVSNAKARSLLSELLKENNRNVSLSSNLKSIPYGFDGIIYEKIYSNLEVMDIKIDNSINMDIFNFLKPRRYNVFVEKMVIALDNAIEASLNSEEKVLVVNLYREENNVIVEIRNTFANNVDLDGIGNIGYSSKGNKRGLGLFSILRNNEASVEVKIHNNLFISKVSAKRNLGK